MKKKLFVLAAVMISAQLQAQQDTTVLDEAVITANKYLNKTSLTGKLVTIISKEQLERSGGKELSQVLAEQAGISIAGANSNTGKDKSLYLRGARAEHTLITIDGIPVYDPSGVGSNFDIRNLSLSGIERIEILKGGQSTLYGSDAIAGVINIITKKGNTAKNGGTASATYGSYHTWRSAAGVHGTKGKMNYTADYAFHKTDGINEAENKNNLPVTDRDGWTSHAVQFKLGIRPAEKLDVQPFFRYNQIDAAIDQGAFMDELDFTYRQKSWQAGVRSQLKTAKIALTWLYSYNHIDRTYIDDSIKSRNGYDTWSKGTYKGGEHFADAFLVTKLRPALNLSAGVDARASGSDQQYSSIGFFGPYNSAYSRDSLHQFQAGLYAALNWNNPSGFNAEAGGRVNTHSAYGGSAVFNMNPSWLIHKQTKLFVNLSSAYRTPSLYQLYSEYGNKDLEPEAAFSAEAGVQFYSEDQKFTGRAVGFSRNVKDVIFFFYNPVTYQSQYINQDRQKDYGAELEATYRISTSMTLRVFYTFVRGSIHTKSGTKDSTYNNLLRRPESSAGINLAVQVKKNLYFSTNLYVAGKRPDAYFDSNTFSTVQCTLPAYALWDAYAEYGFYNSRLRLFVDLRNITASNYREISGFNTQGFNGSAGFRFAFDTGKENR